MINRYDAIIKTLDWDVQQLGIFYIATDLDLKAYKIQLLQELPNNHRHSFSAFEKLEYILFSSIILFTYETHLLLNRYTLSKSTCPIKTHLTLTYSL